MNPESTKLRQITPTDVAQYIRLEQCERYLRLRLQTRAQGDRFLRDQGIQPESIPPLLTRSGGQFEQRIEADARLRLPLVNLATDLPKSARTFSDNAFVAEKARALAPGAELLLLQPRLEAMVGEWRLRGDIDLLLLRRDEDGALHALIADMKSSTSAKMEHRLQVAFYHRMLGAVLAEAGVPLGSLTLGILYRGAADDRVDLTAEERAARHEQRELAQRHFGTGAGLLELLADPEHYLRVVEDLVIGPNSTAARVADAPLEAATFHLTYKCDGCLFNQFCMKWSAEHDDLSLLPHLAAQEKTALRRAGVPSMSSLAILKDLAPATEGARPELIPASGQDELVRRLSATWPVGPRLDELIHRARRYRKWKRDPIEALSYIPHRGQGSLPFAAPDRNPNLVRVYIDAQHDYLEDRIYLLGALVVGCEAGEPRPERRRSIVYLADGPPDAAREEAIFVAWTRDLIRAIHDLAAPDAEGLPRAPIHLIFFNHFEQRQLLAGLSRHFTRVTRAAPLYEFLTQLAAFDSPIATFLDEEIREQKNYPMVCQSLQIVAAYLGFAWDTGEPFRTIFRTRLFDFWRKGEESGPEREWYLGRARYGSQIPLEYAYAAWNELSPPPPGARDLFAPYRAATAPLLRAFHGRRLEAIEHIARDFRGNHLTEKRSFDLPDLAAFSDRAHGLAAALDEFVTIERLVELATWKRIRQAAPEQRVLAGETLIGRYRAADQEPGVGLLNAENRRRHDLREERKAAAAGEDPPSKERDKETAWKQDGLRIRLRCEPGPDCSPEGAMALTNLRAGDGVVVFPRWTVDSRLPVEARTPNVPTPKQMLYGSRATIRAIREERGDDGRVAAVWLELEMRSGFGGGAKMRGFVFGARDRPFEEDTLYTIDADPNDWYGYWGSQVTTGLCAGGANTLYERLVDPAAARVTRAEEPADGQARFLAGLEALRGAGAMPAFEAGKREYIGAHGATPILLVQGPPGTGKSFTTAFAVLARLQGALAAGLPCRVIVACKTHAATDVLLRKVVETQALLSDLRRSRPALMAEYFDARALNAPLFRAGPKSAAPEGTMALPRKRDQEKGAVSAWRQLEDARWCVVGATPGGVYGLVTDRWAKDLFGHDLCQCLVLDEASQLSLPEAIMAALPLAADGRIVVVGDPRQMPPIVKHDWGNEPRRTFTTFRVYESLFTTLLAMAPPPPMIKFEESFRLHAEMAKFLRQEIYARDGIEYFSRKLATLPPMFLADPFVAAVLAPEHTLVVVVHEEANSQHSNSFEQSLLVPLLEALAGEHGFGPEEGLGVVVPHRAQRAALQEVVPALTRRDPDTGAITLSAVNTVERFQGDEREVILVGATESDPDYLLLVGDFLLDPRRLTVALSRAKQKMVLVASRSVFTVFPSDEELFAHALLWKNLLRRTCTTLLWAGERDGTGVQVWGNGNAPEAGALGRGPITVEQEFSEPL